MEKRYCLIMLTIVMLAAESYVRAVLYGKEVQGFAPDIHKLDCAIREKCQDPDFRAGLETNYETMSGIKLGHQDCVDRVLYSLITDLQAEGRKGFNRE